MTADIHYTDPSRQSELPEYDPEATADYVNNLQPIKDQKRKNKRNKYIFLTVLMLAIIGAAVYFLFLKPDQTEQQAPQTSQQTQEEMQPQVAEVKTFTSPEMRLSFDYPGDWLVDDSTTGTLKVSSPVAKMADINGDNVDAKVVVSFLSPGSKLPALASKSGEAVKDSEKIEYSNPSGSQRAETYISFANFSGVGLESVLVTGDSGYQRGQLIPEADIKKGDPIIIVNFYGCADSECAGEGSGALTLTTDEWASNNTLIAVQELLKSLRVE